MVTEDLLMKACDRAFSDWAQCGILAADPPQNGTARIVIGILLLALAALVYWRSKGRSPTSAGIEPSVTGSEYNVSTLKVHQQALQKMEVRMYDYSREVEARIGTQLAVLDRLMNEAQRETDRLEELLELTQQRKRQFELPSDADREFDLDGERRILSLPHASTHNRKAEPVGDPKSEPSPIHFSVEQKQIIVYLRHAGFRPDEIARCMERTVSEIERVIDLSGDGPAARAA
ncbi:MAG: hypothetical protein ACKVT0_02510 [Planctomycetaceae bacterium]